MENIKVISNIDSEKNSGNGMNFDCKFFTELNENRMHY